MRELGVHDVSAQFYDSAAFKDNHFVLDTRHKTIKKSFQLVA